MTYQPIDPMGDAGLAHIRRESARLAGAYAHTQRWSPLAMISILARLDAEIAARKAAEAERDAALVRQAALMAEVLAIIADDIECCGKPTPRDIYSYDEHGNAVDIIGQEPGDDCCGCPVQRHPATILAAVKAALPDLPIPTSEEG